MKITIFNESQQGTGEFDGGKIIEQKPIAFPHEETAVKRVGSLFYWAWGFTKTGGLVPFHPHKGFEIMSYMINGNVAHKDTLGTESVVGPGGIQVMQTGSGVYHQEESFGTDVEGFQIWFEPYLNEAFKMEPTYRQFEHEDFPIVQNNGVSVKTVIGEDSPLTVIVDAKMFDISIDAGAKYKHIIPRGYSVATLVIRGNGSLVDVKNVDMKKIDHKDFIVIDASDESEVIFQTQDEEMRIFMIQVPTQVDYPLYRK